MIAEDNSKGLLSKCATDVYTRLHQADTLEDKTLAGYVKLEAENVREDMLARNRSVRFSFENAVELLAAVGVWLSEHRQEVAS